MSGLSINLLWQRNSPELVASQFPNVHHSYENYKHGFIQK